MPYSHNTDTGWGFDKNKSKNNLWLCHIINFKLFTCDLKTGGTFFCCCQTFFLMTRTTFTTFTFHIKVLRYLTHLPCSRPEDRLHLPSSSWQWVQPWFSPSYKQWAWKWNVLFIFKVEQSLLASGERFAFEPRLINWHLSKHSPRQSNGTLFSVLWNTPIITSCQGGPFFIHSPSSANIAVDAGGHGHAVRGGGRVVGHLGDPKGPVDLAKGAEIPDGLLKLLQDGAIDEKVARKVDHLWMKPPMGLKLMPTVKTHDQETGDTLGTQGPEWWDKAAVLGHAEYSVANEMHCHARQKDPQRVASNMHQHYSNQDHC